MTPTIGRIVLYTLTEDDAQLINRRRTTSKIGNDAHGGDVYPMVIVRAWGTTPESCVNGQVFLDGNDALWVTSVSVGEGPRTWAWPARV